MFIVQKFREWRKKRIYAWLGSALKDPSQQDTYKNISKIREKKWGPRALEVLAQRQDTEAARYTALIGRYVEGMGAPALEILAARTGDVDPWQRKITTECIGELGRECKNLALPALHILAKREGDEASSEIRKIGQSRKEAAEPAINILTKRPGDEATGAIEEIAWYFPEIAVQAINLLATREGKLATGSIGGIAMKHKRTHKDIVFHALKTLATRDDEYAARMIKQIMPYRVDERLDTLRKLSNDFQAMANPQARQVVSGAAKEIIMTPEINGIVGNEDGEQKLKDIINLAATLDPRLPKQKLEEIVDWAMMLHSLQVANSRTKQPN